MEGISRTFAHTLQGADLGAILHGMDGEVDLGNGLLLLNRADCIIDLDVAPLLNRGRSVILALGVHGGRLGVAAGDNEGERWPSWAAVRIEAAAACRRKMDGRQGLECL